MSEFGETYEERAQLAENAVAKLRAEVARLRGELQKISELDTLGGCARAPKIAAEALSAKPAVVASNMHFPECANCTRQGEFFCSYFSARQTCDYKQYLQQRREPFSTDAQPAPDAAEPGRETILNTEESWGVVAPLEPAPEKPGEPAGG